MTGEFWNVRDDFLTATPIQLVEQYWTDDEFNRKRSLETFKEEIALCNEGLSLYMEAIQHAYKERAGWESDDRRRASIAMLIHAFNSFLAWRHLLTHGYLAEGRIIARGIYESLCQAVAFANDLQLSTKFYEGRQIQPREIQKGLSSLLAAGSVERGEVFKQFAGQYRRLSATSHPTLDSFSLRAVAQERGNAGLQKSVPEAVVIGGLLQDDIGRIAWLTLARDIAYALATVGAVLKDATGKWHKDSLQYLAKVRARIDEDEAKLSQLFPEKD